MIKMKNKIKELLNMMTLQEKIGQLNLVSYNDKTEEEVKSGLVGAVINSNNRDDIFRLQKAAGESRLKIPLLIGADVIHGFRTIFPVPLAESCSFNLDLIEAAATWSARAAAQEGINWIYAPILDLTNDPRWGRINESSGEDPFLIGMMAARRIRGIQRDGTVGACCKHYIGYGKVESGVDYLTTDFSEHTLRTYFLPAYRAAVAAGALSMMSAFTTYNALPITASRTILNEILRQELGFNGVLVTDWDSLEHLFNYRLVDEGTEAAAIGIRCGIDIDMHSRIYQKYLPETVKRQPELLGLIDDAVLRVLKLKAKLGLFNQKSCPGKKDFSVIINEYAECLAVESIILLKNENKCLPLNPNTKLLVVGHFNNDGDIHLGAWSALGRPEETVTVEAGIRARFPNSEFFATPKNTGNTDFNALKQKAEAAEMVLLNLGEPRYLSGENNNRSTLDLPDNQDLLAEFLANENIPFIAYVAAGRPLAITGLANKALALLWSFHLGHQAGSALAKILAGIENPSAKTTVTFPRSLGQIPIYYNRLFCGRPELIHYLDEEITPLYPFGYGLSYSEFYYHLPEVSFNKDKQIVTVEGWIENVSDLPGKEVIQVYLLPQKTSVLCPVKSLIGFKKVEVAPHQSVSYQINCPINNKFYGDLVNIMVGPSSQLGKIIKLKL